MEGPELPLGQALGFTLDRAPVAGVTADLETSSLSHPRPSRPPRYKHLLKAVPRRAKQERSQRKAMML